MEININKFRIPFNYVLVKLDQDHDTYHATGTGSDTGIHVAPWGINQASHVSLTGTVMVLPDKLIYNGYELQKLRADKLRSDADQKYIADLRRASMSYDVPVEVPVGTKVYFEYVTRLNAFKEGRAFENQDGKYILIPYDLLIMCFRPGTNFDNVQVNDIYMLNGIVLIKPLEYATERTATGVVGAKTENDIFLPIQPDAKYVKRNNVWYANVLSVGCGVKSYADFPGRGGEHHGNRIVSGCTPGNKIMYDGRQQKRLEVEHHRVIFKKHTLYRIHRKDVLGWFPDGNIS